ncbi:MAG: hypothetical protein AB8B67_00710 [Rickettsiaceae bacterium]
MFSLIIGAGIIICGSIAWNYYTHRTSIDTITSEEVAIAITKDYDKDDDEDCSDSTIASNNSEVQDQSDSSQYKEQDELVLDNLLSQIQIYERDEDHGINNNQNLIDNSKKVDIDNDAILDKEEYNSIQLGCDCNLYEHLMYNQ